MSFSVTSSQTALSLLTGKTATASTSAASTSQTETGQSGPRPAKGGSGPPPPPPTQSAGSSAAAESVFAALSTGFDADSNGTISAAELGSTNSDDDTATLFAAMDSNGDGEMTADELGTFLKGIGDSLSAAGAPPSGGSGGPPPGGGSGGTPPRGGPGGPPPSDSSSDAVSSMLENLIQSQAQTSSLNQSDTALITQFQNLLTQVA